MTLVQIQHRSTEATSVVVEAMNEAGPHVCDDMTVEVALSVMAAARTGHLLVCDADGQCTGLVIQAQLTAVRDGCAYTDRVRLRDILGASSFTTTAEAVHATHGRRLAVSTVTAEHGSAPGVLACSR
ncbi:CBS domain-containing protein [Streptomyces niger]|uniref:CBS domain-containing protein n=1 Tax=Streptomyces niger TaxID=66373 RepID=UPI00069B7932|nr:CBS domain-containing protein [Streptomyces niger]